MSTPKENTPLLTSIPAESYGTLAHAPVALPVKIEPDPDNPPWGIPAAVLAWISSIALLFGTGLISLLFIILYFVSRDGRVDTEQLPQLLTTDKTAILMQVIAVIPAHLLTLGVAWAIVTDFGKRPFWRSLGWGWNRGVGLLASAGLAVALLLLGGLITYLYEGEPTEIDQVINSSNASRFVLAFLATATAPLVEEVIYRGILYPALQRAMGAVWGVVSVTFLFLAVHYWQYKNNISVLATIGILSLALTLVRAYTGRLLPCFIIHLVFNGLQSLYIIFQPYLPQPESLPEQKPGLVIFVERIIGALV